MLLSNRVVIRYLAREDDWKCDWVLRYPELSRAEIVHGSNCIDSQQDKSQSGMLNPMNLTNIAPYDPSAEKETFHDLQAIDQGSTGPETTKKEEFTRYQAQASTRSNGRSSAGGNLMSAHSTGLRSGDGGDDPEDPNRARKTFRGHEVEAADDGRGLMLEVCARSQQRNHLQVNGEDAEDGQDRLRPVKRRSFSCSNGGAEGSSVPVARECGSAPARIRVEKLPSASIRWPLNSDNDPNLRQALIRRASMVRASDITAESTGDAPWVSPIRPSRLNTARRGYRGYGGYGRLANLPDGSRKEPRSGTGQTLLGGYDSSVDNRKVATIGDSFSFASSVSHVSQPTALVEGQLRVRTKADPQDDRGSVISQRQALLEGPYREPSEVASLPSHRSVISQCAALLDGPPSSRDGSGPLPPRAPVGALLSPTIIGLQASTNSENEQPRRPAAPSPLPLSGNELPTYRSSRTRTTSYGIRMGTRPRFRQASSLASLFSCCTADSDDTETSSTDSERSSSETADAQISPKTNQADRARERVAGQAPADMDYSELSNPEQLRNVHANPSAGMVSKKCPRARFAGENERWRDPAPRT